MKTGWQFPGLKWWYTHSILDTSVSPGQRALWNKQLSLADIVSKPEGLVGFCTAPSPTAKLVQEHSGWVRLVGHLPSPKGFPFFLLPATKAPKSWYTREHPWLWRQLSMRRHWSSMVIALLCSTNHILYCKRHSLELLKEAGVHQRPWALSLLGWLEMILAECHTAACWKPSTNSCWAKRTDCWRNELFLVASSSLTHRCDKHLTQHGAKRTILARCTAVSHDSWLLHYYWNMRVLK